MNHPKARNQDEFINYLSKYKAQKKSAYKIMTIIIIIIFNNVLFKQFNPPLLIFILWLMLSSNYYNINKNIPLVFFSFFTYFVPLINYICTRVDLY